MEVAQVDMAAAGTTTAIPLTASAAMVESIVLKASVVSNMTVEKRDVFLWGALAETRTIALACFGSGYRECPGDSKKCYNPNDPRYDSCDWSSGGGDDKQDGGTATNGSSPAPSSASPTPTPSTEESTTSATITGGTSVEYEWYTWTVTCRERSYWSYFYTDITIITSTIYETSTLISVYATNSAEASSSLAEETETMSFYTPPAATALASRTSTRTTSRFNPSTTTSSPFPSVSQYGGSASAGNSRAADLQNWWQLSCLAVMAIMPVWTLLSFVGTSKLVAG
ncbi:hypothetical protein MGYG_08231 [Nannizzia gypsea CBS 118893]|uniref:Uncharacterized protein n=1 Tax=Arthroderma gypseum (strain ATCC MYA-4604 / CBS 118893) TaxID=535722 RepID=E4V5E3_ARTGP|nr:hypothetical protein MGYG_08231 [Nannizzia gypsea CBS 118893]EFR05217.1 hypothetical protein MGYG_08231 [Nannizzia gypsea CBS 118893]